MELVESPRNPDVVLDGHWGYREARGPSAGSLPSQSCRQKTVPKLGPPVGGAEGMDSEELRLSLYLFLIPSLPPHCWLNLSLQPDVAFQRMNLGRRRQRVRIPPSLLPSLSPFLPFFLPSLLPSLPVSNADSRYQG